MSPSNKLPTIARLTAALCLAALGWYGSELVRPTMPPETNFGWFNYVNAGIGLACGWKVIGSRLGTGYTDAISTGLTGVGAMLFWVIFTHSCNQMLGNALDRDYKGLMDALTGIFEIATEYVLYLLHLPLLAALVGGGIVIGLLAEALHRRWS
ncbi:TrgA family protein [Roseovarius sp. C7]|uniref:TrgA family protein n=1 Tax=Roseovarius sp. C7 TaxID=3398643 RepID=UPI0039F6EA41